MPTIAVFRLHRLRARLAWLVLAAVLLRGLLPVGYMPVPTADGAPGIRLAICSGGFLVAGDPAAAGHHIANVQCPYAFSAMAAIPPVFALLALSAEASLPPRLQVRPVAPDPRLQARPPARAPPLHS